MLPKNINNSGRIVRFILGALLLGYAAWQGSWIALGFSLFLFFEVVMSWCAVRHVCSKMCCCKK
ncbi:MAG: DUF2892 domain-containing protein [Verrucomicrobia bacterium]|nr:DUF2892 domain-containing protein [Verrucomicrobiota bacterium]